MTDADRAVSPRHAWIDPLAAGANYAAGVALIAGWPKSFAGADDRIALAAPIAAAVAAVASAPRRSIVAALCVAAATLVATVPTLLPMRDLTGDRRWSSASLALVAIGLAIVGIVCAAAFGAICRRGAGGAASLVLLGMAGATGGLAMLTGSMRVAEKTWPLAIALAIAAIVGIFLRDRRASAGLVAFAIAVIVAQLAAAHLWSDLALWQAACVVVAAPLAWATLAIPVVARRRPWLRGAIVLLVAATPAIVASGLAAAEAYRSSQSSGAADDEGY